MIGRALRVAVATSSTLAADAAREIADLGGNAVDCAIAAAMLTMNTQPGVCALAGGAYVTVWAPGTDALTIDGNVAIPGLGAGAGDGSAGAVPVHMDYGGGIDTLVGAGSVAVPGALAALEKASADYGRLAWRDLLAPTVRAARDGFPLPRACHYYLQFSGRPVFGRSHDGFAALHHADGRLRERGDRIVVPHLADSLAAIAEDGCGTFYCGELAASIVGHVRAGGGRLTMTDLCEYRPIVRPALTVDVDDWTVAVNPPPAIGGTVLAAMLAAFRGPAATAWDRRALMTLIDVQRTILGFRRETLDLSDDVPRDAQRLLEQVHGGRLPPPGTSGATVHTSAVDGAGLGCAVTASAGYGSGEMPDATGLWLNNCLGELELNRRGLSAAPAGARLPSNMSPAVARRAGTVLAIGSPGADRITTALHQFLFHFIRRGLTLAEAVAHPRLHLDFRSEGMRVAVEPGLEPGDCDLPVVHYPDISMYFGGVAAALFDGVGGFDVAADPRREGATFVSGESTGRG